MKAIVYVMSLTLTMVISVSAASNGKAESGVEDKVKQLEKEWADAGVKRDAAAYGRLEADNFVSTDPAGHVGGKEGDLSDLKSGNFTAQNMTVDEMKVQVYGNVAVVTGRTTITAGKYGGQDLAVSTGLRMFG